MATVKELKDFLDDFRDEMEIKTVSSTSLDVSISGNWYIDNGIIYLGSTEWEEKE